jgi:protein gp37
MKKTKIQWCHSTMNPVMGCHGCELWKPAAVIAAIMLARLLQLTKKPKGIAKPAVNRAVGDRETSELYRDREQVAEHLAGSLGLTREQKKQVVDVIREECKCYAGLLGTNRAGNPGYADKFEIPKVYPGRVAEAASWGLPTEKETRDKPWLKGFPRLIFISDMGDALSTSVPFDYQRGEIIENAVSEGGRRHLWLWLTKRPGRMAEFGEWLQNQGIAMARQPRANDHGDHEALRPTRGPVAARARQIAGPFPGASF